MKRFFMFGVAARVVFGVGAHSRAPKEEGASIAPLQTAIAAFEKSPPAETASSLAEEFVKEKKIDEGITYFEGIVGRGLNPAPKKTAGN